MRADMRRASSLAFLLALALFLAACGSKQAPESKAPAPEIDHERDDSGGVEMTQEFGGMNEEKVKKTIEKLYPTLSDCLMNGSKRVDFLGGEVAFLVKVNSAGTAEVAHAERSTLGDYASERCMLDTLEKSRWPKPVGGRIGLARTSIAFDPPSDVRPPVDWSASDIQTALEKNEGELAACGNGGPFEITAYVDTKGRVMTAGIAHADDSGDEAAACLVQAVESIQFGSPGSWPAKVTFRR
jgi:predicted small lipoprotein YifL